MLLKVYLWSFIVFLIAEKAHTQECRSYNRKNGNCVSIKRCPPLLNALKTRLTANQLRQLQRLTCGFENQEPKVCCPVSVITHPAENSGSNKTAERLDLTSHPAFSKIPNITECGISTVHNRVIGGKNASLGSFPWMVRIAYKSKTSVGYLPQIWKMNPIAHCTDSIEDDYAPIEVRVGEHDAGSEFDCDPNLTGCTKAEDYKIKKLIPHANYSSNTKQNDISLILLEEDINFEKFHIKPICLPFVNEFGILDFINRTRKGIVAGWGRTQWNKAAGSRILQQVTVPVKTNEECQKLYKRRVTISSNQLCAGGVQGQDSCGGDSGGPLIVEAAVRRLPRYFQLGVVSFGPVQCGIGMLPGVYARTSSYLKWILDKILENE